MDDFETGGTPEPERGGAPEPETGGEAPPGDRERRLWLFGALGFVGLVVLVALALAVTDLVALIGFIAFLTLAGGGLYLAHRNGLLGDWVDGFKEYWAARDAAMAQRRAASYMQERIGIETPVSPPVVLEAAVEHMTRQGWGVQSRTQTSVTFSRDEGANPWLTCCLAFLFIVPAILYALLYYTTKRVTVQTDP